MSKTLPIKGKKEVFLKNIWHIKILSLNLNAPRLHAPVGHPYSGMFTPVWTHPNSGIHEVCPYIGRGQG